MTRDPEAKRLNWHTYPHTSRFRNPYVKGLRTNLYKKYCADCGAAIALHNGRCRACGREQLGRIRPNNLNAQHVVAAAESGKFKNMACIAEEIGISRERVRQILNATGRTEFGYRRLRLEWPCPDCGEAVSLTRRELERTTYMPAHCRKCANKYCRRGHLRIQNTRGDRYCRACERIRSHRIVEVRTCRECGKDLEISEGASYQIRTGRSRGEYHKDCYYAYRRNPAVGALGLRIDERARELGMNQSAFADYCGISQHTLSSLRRGRSGMKVGTALNLARGLGITVDEVITGEASASAYIRDGTSRAIAQSGVSTLGSIIDERGKELGMTQEAFAKHCGISVNGVTVFRFGRGGTQTRAGTALKLARGLGITIEELIERMAAPDTAG